MPSKRGYFIVIEGMDGAGTTTQAELLCRAIRGVYGAECVQTREPSDGPVGLLIRDILEKHIPPPRDAYGDELAERDTLSLLFTADRMDHLNRVVIPAVRDGKHVVSDRYMHSTCAYQMKGAEHLEWILKLHENALIPDLTIFFDVPVDDALVRIRGRAGKPHAAESELFETREQLERISAGYHTTLARLKSRGDRIATLDGRPSPAEVHASAMNEIQLLFNK
jgi:dTMP kinase